MNNLPYDENEAEEKRRLAKESVEANDRASKVLAKKLVLAMGEEYERTKGAAAVSAAEYDLSAITLSYARLMGSNIMFGLPALDAMLVIMAKIPAVLGFEILQRKEYTDLQASLLAVRMKLIRERDARAKASSPELFTASGPGEKQA